MEEKEWIFTFCQNDEENKRKFVAFEGTYSEARDKMVERFGHHWAFQYPSKEEAGVYKFNLEEIIK